MGKQREDRDLAIKIAISGNDRDIGNPGVAIVDDYLKREKRENFRESLLWIRPVVVRRTETEVSIWIQDKRLEELNTARWDQLQAAKEAHLEIEYDIDRMDCHVDGFNESIKF
jgi:hypothetical protein